MTRAGTPNFDLFSPLLGTCWHRRSTFPSTQQSRIHHCSSAYVSFIFLIWSLNLALEQIWDRWNTPAKRNEIRDTKIHTNRYRNLCHLILNLAWNKSEIDGILPPNKTKFRDTKIWVFRAERVGRFVGPKRNKPSSRNPFLPAPPIAAPPPVPPMIQSLHLDGGSLGGTFSSETSP
jgi:hypothetical protein